MLLLAVFFWCCVYLIFHSYVFYPLILEILSYRKKGNQVMYERTGELPMVSIVISAFNEEEVIAEKIESIYNGDYPPEKFELLIGSDHSDDRTAGIVNNYAAKHKSLHFIDFKERRGKQNVVNDLVLESKGSILILTDANVMFDTSTIFKLVRHFKNSEIGLVDTNMINKGLKIEGISYQEKAYISREVHIKNMEGRLWGTMMGPFGGCYAIRKEDYSKVPPNYLVDDFYINMKVFEKYRKAINDLEAKVFEDVSNVLKDEFRRKVRIATGNWQNLRTFYGLLFRPRLGFCFLSHKVLRWMGPFFILATLILNIALAFYANIYIVILALQLILFSLPLLDFILKKLNIHNKLLRMVTHFYAMNLALFIGFFRSMKRIHSGTWDRTPRNQ
ncbi:MAG: glycosyltransferase [Bacteroidales bacterium]|nr:glycosyltransferase [Bacteroidales bacterium]